MAVALGIDTGGTYTDAVLVDQESGQVLAQAKALTTYRDLAIGIGRAVRAVFAGPENPIPPDRVDMVALSTTLATNAIVEEQGSTVCLLLIGYDVELIRRYGFERELVTQHVVYLAGGHDGLGNEREPLDEAAARAAILAYRKQVDAFAISGHFGVRNPAHELRVKQLVAELTGPVEGRPMPVTCGHELTTRLNAVRRATTAALNARLIPLLQELIATVQATLDQVGLSAPLMVVKGDGSLVRAGWAMQRPIETILSGPAASVIGAWHLAERRDVWVVDVGGTTTDIAVLEGGRPRLNVEGAQVGRWRTMVEAVDVHTVGLGGDSHVQVAERPILAGDWLLMGPRRVMPLCLLAAEHQGVVAELERQVEQGLQGEMAGRFVLARRRSRHALSEEERELLSRLAEGPRSLRLLAVEADNNRFLLSRRVEGLVGRGLVQLAAFTPTDALHVLGHFDRWDKQAARLGAGLLAGQVGLSVEEFCRRVVDNLSDRVTTELVSKVLSNEVVLPDWPQEPAAKALLNRALDGAAPSALACRLTLKQPVVAIGAPVAAYLPRTSRQLHTELIVPECAGVANAVGAVAGGVVQQMRVLINPLDAHDTAFRAHLPGGVRDFKSVEGAVEYVQQVVPEQLEKLARQAGAEQVEINTAREEQIAAVGGALTGKIYLGTELTFTAVGRPSF